MCPLPSQSTPLLSFGRTKLFSVLIRKEVSFHDVNDSGTLTSRLTSDCYAVSRCVATNVNVAMRNGLQVIGGWPAVGARMQAALAYSHSMPCVQNT